MIDEVEEHNFTHVDRVLEVRKGAVQLIAHASFFAHAGILGSHSESIFPRDGRLR